MIKLGVSKGNITPNSALRLSGYADRTGAYESIREPIFVRVQAFAYGEQCVVLIYGDLIWWGNRFIAELRPSLADRFRLHPSAFVLIASHNHSGPATSQDFSNELESYDQDYGALLARVVHDCVANALSDLEPVNMRLHQGKGHLGIYRRRCIDGRMEMRPNASVPIDDSLSIVALHRGNGSLKALMIHYACHPTISRENHLHPEYPGVLMRLLEQSLPGCHGIFLQGCTADIRPNRVLNDEFLAGDYHDVIECSRILHRDCLDALEKPGQPLKPVDGRCLLNSRSVQLDGSGTGLNLYCIQLASGLQWIGFNAEVSQYYQLYLKSKHPGCLGVAYCNGMVGYVCSREQIVEGGYEPVGSVPYFKLPGPFSATIQTTIEEALDELIHHSKEKSS